MSPLPTLKKESSLTYSRESMSTKASVSLFFGGKIGYLK